MTVFSTWKQADVQGVQAEDNSFSGDAYGKQGPFGSFPICATKGAKNTFSRAGKLKSLSPRVFAMLEI